MNSDITKQAVRIANGIEVLSKKELNAILGKFILLTLDPYEVKSAIKEVAQEEFKKEHGKVAKSWVDLADNMAENTDASFASEVLNSLWLQRA
jgi:hypothetical protein